MENEKQYFEINYVDIYKSIKNIKGMNFEEVAENTLNAMKKAINECNDKLKEIDKNVYYHKLVDGYLGYVSVYDTNTKERKDIEVTIQKDEDKKNMQKAVDIVVERFKKNLLYEAEIDRIIDVKDSLSNESNYLKICKPTETLKQVGLDDNLITMKRGKVRICCKDKELGGHGINRQTLYNLPELFENPAIIMKSQKEEKSIIVFLNDIDNEKNPIVASIKPDEKGTYDFEQIDTNLLTSIYGRENFSKFLNDNKDKILFTDEFVIKDLEVKTSMKIFNKENENLLEQQQ